MYCSCIKNTNKIIAEELQKSHYNNEGVSNEELLNYLKPLMLKHPVAHSYYNIIFNNLNKKITPSAVIENEQAYLWLIKFYS